MRQAFTILLLLSATLCAVAQDTIPNAGLDIWHGGYFSPSAGSDNISKCCGIALAVPTDWGIPEQLMAMPGNQFVYKETDTAHIHSGAFSARLYTNLTEKDSAGDVAGGLAVLVPGWVSCAGIIGLGSLGVTGDLYKTIAYSTGMPFSDTPRGLSFYMMVEHDVADTMHYAYVFTRWDSAAHIEDTLAYQEVDIPDAGLPYSRWVHFTHDIDFTSAGMPDTVHLIFYGGRNGDSTKVGNTTWLDDISFYHSGYSTTGLVHVDMDDAVSVYPNPASSTIHIRPGQNMTGGAIELYDLTGRRVMNETLSGQLSSYPIGPLANGVYLYRLLDKNDALVTSGKLSVEK